MNGIISNPYDFTLPKFHINLLSSIQTPDMQIAKTLGESNNVFYKEVNFLENPYFLEYFENENSPEIKVTDVVVDSLIKQKHPGFYCNIVKEDGNFRLLNDADRKHFHAFCVASDELRFRYHCIIDFLKYAHQISIEDYSGILDLIGLRLGRKSFLKEFKNFVKIIPFNGGAPDSEIDYAELHSKIRDVVLEDEKRKSMSDWDIHAFNKFYLSFTVDDDNLDKPYIKVYTRDSAEAAQLVMNLMGQYYVEIVE